MADLIDVAAARGLVLEATGRLATEELDAAGALGRVLAEDVESPHDVPPFDSSAMDGYAVVAGTGGERRIVGEARAGHPSGRRVEAGEAIAISTGAQLPAGADVAVVAIERCETSGDGTVTVADATPGLNVRRAGEDIRGGEAPLRRGAVLGPAELAVAATLGRDRLSCAIRPRLAVLVTGDELVPPGRPLGPGQIRDSNATALVAQGTEAGAAVVARETVPDDRAATEDALGRALAGADVVCVSGGVSVGPHDHVRPALGGLGVEEIFWGVRLKPGKPTWFGTRGEVLVFGLPGNPVSAMVTFQLFVRPALRRLQGAEPGAARATATLACAVDRNPARDEAVRCRLETGPAGLRVEPTGEQGSHVLSSMLGADALAMIPAGDGRVEAGEPVLVEVLRL